MIDSDLFSNVFTWSCQPNEQFDMYADPRRNTVKLCSGEKENWQDITNPEYFGRFAHVQLFLGCHRITTRSAEGEIETYALAHELKLAFSLTEYPRFNLGVGFSKASEWLSLVKTKLGSWLVVGVILLGVFQAYRSVAQSLSCPLTQLSLSSYYGVGYSKLIVDF